MKKLFVLLAMAALLTPAACGSGVDPVELDNAQATASAAQAEAEAAQAEAEAAAAQIEDAAATAVAAEAALAEAEAAVTAAEEKAAAAEAEAEAAKAAQAEAEEALAAAQTAGEEELQDAEAGGEGDVALIHGDGNLFGTTLAQVEIECSDCHGETNAYPWELPIGYGEELLPDFSDEPRGVSMEAPEEATYGTEYDVEDGYLLTARGNPFGNVVRRGNDVVVHSATGRDYVVPTLKGIKEAGAWKSPDAEVAMDKIEAHQENLECYACHADWAPQCYGCHVTADYTEGNEGTDWVAVGNSRNASGVADTSLKLPGKISEGRTYLRWEDPILGINGEGRVTPLIPGCQVIYTVIGPDGQNVVNNVIGHTLPGEEGGGENGQRGIDMAPAQPHTVGREARKCESCHSDPKALGYGIGGGKFLLGYDEGFVIDLRDADGNIIPTNYQTQIPAIPDLPMDLTQIVNPETGEQMQTVGSHWPASGPLTADQRERMERTGVCMGCHVEMADSAFWTDQVIAKYGEIASNDDHINVMNQLIKDAVSGADEETLNELASAQDQVEALTSEAEASQEQFQNLEAELAEAQAAQADAEAALAEAETTAAETSAEAPAEAPAAPASNNTLYIVLALVGGLLAGAGIAYAALKKS